jgi:hypothetical protein
MRGVDTLIASVLILIISIAAMFLALQLGVPSTQKTKEILLAQEGKNNLVSIDSAVKNVLTEGEGSTRVLKFSISGGYYKIDNLTNSILFSMESSSQIIAEGSSKMEDGINFTASIRMIYLNLSYDEIQILGEGDFGRGYHTLTIRNNGYNETTQKQMIYVSLVPLLPPTLVTFTSQYNQDGIPYILSGTISGGIPNNLNDLGINTYDIKENYQSSIGDGILVYGEGSVQMPRYRLWSETSQTWGSELSAGSIGGTIEWVSVKTSPIRDEYILATADAYDDINVQIYSNKTGTLCWHNSILCNSVIELTTASTAANVHKMDLAYEKINGRAIFVYSDNTSIPKYVIWNGDHWSSQQNIPVTKTSGIIEWIKLIPRPNSNEIALVYSDSRDSLNAMIWDGNSWKCEPSSALSTNLYYPDYKKFDADYEQLSGDLFIVHSINNTGDLMYTTKSADTCTYSTAIQTNFNEIGMIISVSSQIGSDYILVSESDGGQDDLHGGIWNGTSWLVFGAIDTSIYASNAVPNQLHSVAWSGTSSYGILVYSDAATNTVIDYYIYNKTSNAWITTTDFSPSPLLSDEDNNILTISFMDQNKTMVIIKDEAADLWAKVFDGNTLSWINTEGGSALETSVSSLEFPSFDFDFKPKTYNLEVWHNSSTISYTGTLVSVNATINFTTTETDFYNLHIYDFANSQWVSSECDSGNVLANTPTKWWCVETISPSNYVSLNNLIMIRVISTTNKQQGILKEDYIQYYVTYTQ